MTPRDGLLRTFDCVPPQVRETLSGMLRFHRREAKPQWWRRYEWIARPPTELVADPRTLGELHRTEREPFKSAPRKRRLAYEYRWAHPQQSNLCEASNVVLRDDAPFVMGAVLGASGNGAAAEATALTTAPIDGSGEELRSLGATLLSLDRTTGLALIECGQEPPQQLSVLPNEFVDGAPVARALRQVAAAMVAKPTMRTALGELLARRRPTVVLPSAAADAAAGGTPPAEGPMAPVCAGEDVVDAAVARVLALRRSYLCVQGPPGTGKTYTAARCIAALVAEGRRVGVMAVSHRAVTHLMRQSLELIAEGHGPSGAPGEPVVDGHGTIARAVRSCAAVRLGGSPEELHELERVCVAASDDARGSKVNARGSKGDGEGRDGEGRAGVLLSVRQLSGASGLKKGGLAAAELLVGGTAWAMASEELCAQLDVLFIDEAGQLPLAQLAGASRSAQSLVLLGDQMQLPAPTEGHHPAASGASCLEYLLQGAETVPPALGLFLPTSYRLHPALCELVSRLSYRGKLKPHAATASRKIVLAPDGSSELVRRALGDLPRAPVASAKASPTTGRPPLLCVAGVAHVPVEHEGNSQASHEEAGLIASLCTELLRAELVFGSERRPLRPEDLLVVAPYNLQVRVLEAALPPRVRVGTVDRFQGQEAPIVLLSLCHSDFDSSEHVDSAAADVAKGSGGGGGWDVAAGSSGGTVGSERGLSFVLNLNRLNVALSRAQCLALVISSPRLAEATPRSLQQQRELSALCAIMEASPQLSWSAQDET
jgi:hypothetical protein